MVDYTAIFNKFNQQPRNLLEAIEANRLKNQQEQARQLALRQTQQSVDFNEQANPLKLAKAQFDNMSEQDKFVEQDLLQASIELQPFLDAKDSQSVMQSLQMRRNKLAQNGLRTDEIDSAIQLAQNGQFDTLKQLTASQIQAGRMIGLLDDNRQNLPAGIQYADALAQARASGDKQRVRDILTMTKAEKLPVGTTYNDDGTVSNIGGLEDALGSQEGAKKYAGSQAVLPAEQAKQDMRVGAESQISDITTQNKIGEKEKIEQNKVITDAQVKYPKIEQQAEETLNLVDRLINNPSLYDATGVLQSKIPTVFQDTKDFELLNDQLTNQTFLQAFEQLRGGGQITDVEGLKATLAKLQNSLSGSPKLFIESAKNLQKQIIKSTRSAKNLADGKVFYKTQTTQQPQQSNQSNSIEFLGFE